MDSILDSVKKLLGIEVDYTHFDADIILHINTVFVILCQMGVGPEKPFIINDNQTIWKDFFGDKEDNMVKSYIFMKVKMAFDPPISGLVKEITEQQISEFEWRLNVAHDTIKLEENHEP